MSPESAALEPPVPVLFEDAHVLVVFKPPGWIVQGARPDDPSLLATLRAWIRTRDAKPGEAFLAVVHRLDRPVCGVVVFAKRSKAASRLSDEIRTRRFEKAYRAIVEGTPAASQATLAGRIAWDDPARRARIVEAAELGQDAELRYSTVETRGPHSLLSVELVTGRKHQIRAQLAAAGHPVAGDSLYGSDTPLGDVALCAWEVAFHHPTRREDQVRVAVPAALDPFPEWWAEIGG